MMKLYNTLGRQVEIFRPLHLEKIGIYSCGPTVYDHIHIGNLSAFIVADTLRRTLQIAYPNSTVKHVMNFTDVDDKTIQRSRKRYPKLESMAALIDLTTEYSDIFLKDMQAVGNNTNAISFIKATESIADMQRLIGELLQHDIAYIADDGIYFSIDAYRKTGKIYGQLTDIDESSTSTARIQNDEYDKTSIHDFALWKKQKSDEPSWPFMVEGKDLTGRPGWHIECSAMSRALLGQPFDIHTGGVDLIFPHHENEIAQSTATGKYSKYASFFIHNEHILVDGRKMSKSLNNFYTLEDIIDKGFDPLAFRLLVLQAHYRSQAHFSWENLEAAQARLNSYRAMADLQFQPRDESGVGLVLGDFEHFMSLITDSLFDDLNTPAALKVLSNLESDMSLLILERDQIEHFKALLKFIDDLLGLKLSKRVDITDTQKQLVKQRKIARQAEEWTTSDRIRDQLKGQGIALRDTQYGQVWSRI